MSRVEAELEALRAAAVADPDVPETVRNFLAGGAALDEIRLDARGRWWHQGEMFSNVRLSALFHRSLRRTPSGTWLLEIAPYSYPVLVDDLGQFATRLRLVDGQLVAERLDGRSEVIEPASLVTDGEEFLGYRGLDGALTRLIGDAWHEAASRIDRVEEHWTIRVGDVAHRVSARES